MKGKERKTAFIFFHLFFGIRIFQRVTADSNKKNFPRLRAVSKATLPSSTLPAKADQKVRRPLGNQYHRTRIFAT
jgi:hypothetical protein